MDHSASAQFAITEASIRHVHERTDAFSTQYVIVHRLQVHLVKRINELINETLKPHGLSHSAFTALMMLYGSCGNALNPSLMSDCTGESRANTTRVADELVGLGLVSREASLDDRRRHVLSLTASGVRMIEAVLPSLGARMDAVFAALTEKECAQMIALQKKLLAAVDAVRPATGAPA